MSEQETKNNAPELDLNEILKVRREKLSELQQNGMDPFEITKFDRSHTSSDIKDNYTEEEREITKRGSDEVEKIMAKIS